MFECQFIAFGTIIIVQSFYWDAWFTVINKNTFAITFIPFLFFKWIRFRFAGTISARRKKNIISKSWNRNSARSSNLNNYVIVDARLFGDADELCSDVEFELELDFGESSLFTRTAVGFELFTLTAVRLTLCRLFCGGGGYSCKLLIISFN